MTLAAAAHEAERMGAGDAFVVPPGLAVAYTECSQDLELLEVALPGRFATNLQDPTGG